VEKLPIMKIASLKKLGEYLGQEILFSDPILRFSIDSRKILNGDIYCALPGKQVNGEDFLEDVFKKGAIAAIVSKGYRGPVFGKTIYVENVVETLQDLARKVFQENRPKHVIAITGSLGKTTAKEFISTLLEGSFRVFKTPGNSNSQVCLPLAILNGFEGQEAAVLEMGMTHSGQIEKLVSICPPDIALITKIALVHAENFSSLEGIEQAKGEIFLHPHTKLGIYPFESKNLNNCGACEKKTFGLDDSEADFSLFSIQKYPIGDLIFKEPHILHNLLAALSIAFTLKIDIEIIQRQLKKLALPEMRMQKLKKNGVFFINDSYNAAPDSIIAALKALPVPEAGKKRIAVIGEMAELGSFSEDCHRVVGLEALDLVDHLICYGKNCAPMADVWENADKPCAYLNDHEKVAAYLKELAAPGDVVLLKGSNSTKMWTIMDKFNG
jgi:UDP-N-acetylmuramoyl-tripeptide--D-alanyl-D-alanine ligase